MKTNKLVMRAMTHGAVGSAMTHVAVGSAMTHVAVGSAMTHVAVGSAMGMVIWVAWAGFQVVSGDRSVTPVHRPTVAPASTGVRPVDLPCCLVPADHRHPGLNT